LVLAGGVFANVKLNQRLREVPGVESVYVFPNMGDGGLSVGAAWLAHVGETGRVPEPLGSLMLGPIPGEHEVEAALAGRGFQVTRSSEIEETIASLLADGHVVAHVDGRMEFGPRALGNRSVLCPATDPRINEWLNRRFHRSEFMPFAPATLAEHAEALFEGL